jgi:hypothetical protein
LSDFKLGKVIEYNDTLKLFIDLYENLKGIGKVYIKMREKLNNITGDKGTRYLARTSDVNKVQLFKGNGCIERKKDKYNKEYNPDNLGPYTKVFDESKNEDIYKVIKTQIDTQAVQHYNMMLLSYGLSGSGKTYTLFGKIDPLGKEEIKENDYGISQMIVKHLLDSEEEFTVKLSAYQIYINKKYKALPNENIQVYKFSNKKEDKDKDGINYIKNDDNINDFIT